MSLSQRTHDIRARIAELRARLGYTNDDTTTTKPKSKPTTKSISANDLRAKLQSRKKP